jgi:hypothetical protein
MRAGRLLNQSHTWRPPSAERTGINNFREQVIERNTFAQGVTHIGNEDQARKPSQPRLVGDFISGGGSPSCCHRRAARIRLWQFKCVGVAGVPGPHRAEQACIAFGF